MCRPPRRYATSFDNHEASTPAMLMRDLADYDRAFGLDATEVA